MDRDETICFCMNVTVGDIEDAIKDGCSSLEEVIEKTGASTGCGGCLDNLTALVNELLK